MLLEKQHTLFKVMVPQLLIWSSFQLFYLIVHGISKTNFGIHHVFLSLTNMTSSIILGASIPQLIISWMAVSRKTRDIGEFNYQLQYWAVVAFVIVLSVVFEIILAIRPSYYFIWMKVTLGLWTIYLIICGAMLVYYGLKIYRSTAVVKGDNDKSTARAHRYIPRILACLCGVIFLPVCCLFLFYIIYMEKLESSSWLPIFIWGILWTGSCIFVGFWTVYFYITTSNQVKDTQSSSRNSPSTRRTVSDGKMTA